MDPFLPVGDSGLEAVVVVSVGMTVATPLMVLSGAPTVFSTLLLQVSPEGSAGPAAQF